MRLSTAFAALASGALLAGCGGSTSDVRQQSLPGIPPSVAQPLAAASDSIADRLDAGDECGAAKQADALKEAADEAISSGRIPAAYQDEVERAVTALQENVNCESPGKGHGHDKGHADNGKGEKKGHSKHEDDDQGDDATTTTTAATTTTTATTTTEDGG
ncbi:MAG TPA: hypothetical protein VFW80_11070 [Gaiellaceae bacterium]|nr:hypothetical protein [Gaiellaceae bacterium]